MKTLLIFILLVFNQFIFAQKSEPIQMDSQYRESTTEVFSTVQVVIGVDEYNKFKLEPGTNEHPNPIWEFTSDDDKNTQKPIPDELGNVMHFESISEIINYMTYHNWQFVSSEYINGRNGKVICVLLLKKYYEYPLMYQINYL